MTRSLDYIARLVGWSDLAIQLVGACSALADAYYSDGNIMPYVQQISRIIRRMRELPSRSEAVSMQQYIQFLDDQTNAAKEQINAEERAESRAKPAE
jgi:hypothetical protein